MTTQMWVYLFFKFFDFVVHIYMLTVSSSNWTKSEFWVRSLNDSKLRQS